MYQHIVQPGDTIYSIANQYGISPARLILENEINDPDRMAIGETLQIVLPKETYIVQEGDTLSSIAESHGVSWIDLLSNNPYIADRGGELELGEELVIRFENDAKPSITINGYTYPYISKDVLYKTLPFLTYLTVIGYQISTNGTIEDINDFEIVQISKNFGVAPIMEVFTDDYNVLYTILHDNNLQNNLIQNIYSTVQAKGYYGINFDTPYIYPEDKQLYVEFLEKLTYRLNGNGYLVVTTISPSTFEVAAGITYFGVDYTGISQASNKVIYNLSYDWANRYGLPKTILSFESKTKAVEDASKNILPEKVLLGIAIIGFRFELPFIGGTTEVTFMNHRDAMSIARDYGLEVQYNEINQSSFIHYIQGGLEYLVSFKDVKSMKAFTDLLQENNLDGISLWNIMYYYPRTWLLIHSLFEVNKVLSPMQ